MHNLNEKRCEMLKIMNNLRIGNEIEVKKDSVLISYVCLKATFRYLRNLHISEVTLAKWKCHNKLRCLSVPVRGRLYQPSIQVNNRNYILGKFR